VLKRLMESTLKRATTCVMPLEPGAKSAGLVTVPASLVNEALPQSRLAGSRARPERRSGLTPLQNRDANEH